MTGPPRPPPEFPYFPFKTWRVNPSYLEGRVRHADPWGRREAWRYNDFFSAKNRIRNMTPGLGIATVAFAVYVAYDKWYQSSGPGAEENAKWAKWMEEREERIGGGGSHGHGHH
ncbi:hypothetical protein HDU89_004705 [Geranomyces variabilis]|nr:hypothetical protein HDU89_004705 [Geranomyces variabilis]KAJ3166282.1 hypothetical protein HDU88_003506 [Geranomyces variabilis]